MELNKRYIIDLSQAQSPADIVFELSNIIEKEEAANKKIWLKLGEITLNQSQLLSINSLISSINSTLSLIESQSQQTELAAATLGISTRDVEEELQAELAQLEAKAPEDEPSQQYIPISDHVDTQSEEIENKEESVETQSEESTPVEKDNLSETDNDVFEELKTEAQAESKKTDNADKTDEENAEIPQQQIQQQSIEVSQPASETGSEPAEEAQEKENSLKDVNLFPIEPMSEEKEEEIQEQLDSIFDSETKLENILSQDKDITEMQNWPLTKEEEDDFEIPEDEMTDEDYEILQMNTQYHKQTVRSGQVIKSNGNVVIIGDCHPGCEIHAAGDITVWGILGGIAHAGCKGNTKARIRALNLNAIQLRIADSYARRPDHIKNVYVEKSNTFVPEEARNVNGSIVILKINDK